MVQAISIFALIMIAIAIISKVVENHKVAKAKAWLETKEGRAYKARLEFQQHREQSMARYQNNRSIELTYKMHNLSKDLEKLVKKHGIY